MTRDAETRDAETRAAETRAADTRDAERFAPEPAKRPLDAELAAAEADRSPYARDRARVLHSAAFRRLASKTQVHTAGTSEMSAAGFLRTRLTHSLEVAQIAREMGERLGCDPDVVDVAGLAHDLGHPPFGHNGEDALNEAAAPAGGFEGNAQTLRVLTRLEAKIDGAGLNLTRACLDAACKYPWPRRSDTRKFGVYADDAPVFDWLRERAPDQRRCLEAQVMDWADDVAYSVHDVEDGFNGGFVTLRPLIESADERAALCKDVAEVYSDEPADELLGVLDELLTEPALAALVDFDGGHRALVALKAAASLLIGRFVAAAVAATRAAFGGGELRRYDADLVVPRLSRAQCALLKGIALRYVMRREGATERYARQQAVLRELVSSLVERGDTALDPVFAPLWRAAPHDAARLRVVIDQVASLTDPAAVAWHRRLCG